MAGYDKAAPGNPDGDNASGFAWKAVSLKEKCPVDEINCVEEDRDGSVVAL